MYWLTRSQGTKQGMKSVFVWEINTFLLPLSLIHLHVVPSG